MKENILKVLFEEYVNGTPEKAVVIDKRISLCNLTYAVMRGINIEPENKNVFICSRVVKHLYDKKPAEEFNFLLEFLHKIVRYPDKIYKNQDSKRGEFCFAKMINGQDYLCSLEVVKIPPVILGVAQFGISKFGQEKEMIEIHVVTAFRNRKSDKYLKNYTLLWDWGTGNPHRSALDTPKGSTNAPQ
jgi:hypothetical protein